MSTQFGAQDPPGSKVLPFPTREERIQQVGVTYLEVFLKRLVAWMARRHTVWVAVIAGVTLAAEIALHIGTVTIILPIIDVLCFGHDDIVLGSLLAVSTGELVRRGHRKWKGEDAVTPKLKEDIDDVCEQGQGEPCLADCQSA